MSSDNVLSIVWVAALVPGLMAGLIGLFAAFIRGLRSIR